MSGGCPVSARQLHVSGVRDAHTALRAHVCCARDICVGFPGRAAGTSARQQGNAISAPASGGAVAAGCGFALGFAHTCCPCCTGRQEPEAHWRPVSHTTYAGQRAGSKGACPLPMLAMHCSPLASFKGLSAHGAWVFGAAWSKLWLLKSQPVEARSEAGQGPECAHI